jgi:hypothetical protein
MTDPTLLSRCIASARAVERHGITHEGETVEAILDDLGIPWREQVRIMGSVIDRMRSEWSAPPQDTSRTVCHWCEREFSTPGGRGMHEKRCRDTLARNRRITEAYQSGMSGTEIAEAEDMAWSHVYKILRDLGVMQEQRAAS